MTITATSIATYGQYIDGAWTGVEASRLINVINPATEDVVAQVTKGTTEEARLAISSARRAFDSGPWSAYSVEQRREVLRRMLTIFERRRDELVEINIATGGAARPIAEFLQVDVALSHLRDMVDRVMPTFEWERPGPAHVGAGVGQGIVVREAFGVASLISAYNFPLLLHMVKIVPALAAGCTAILKPAATTPVEALIIAEVADEAGLPKGVLNVVTGGREIAYEMSTNPDVDVVSFTGSDEVGRLIYQQAAGTLKKVILELGGKSASIITEDANLEKAAQEIVSHTTMHAGQGCALLTRALVHESRVDDFVALLKKGFADVRVANPMDASTTMGPLISAEQREKVEELVAQGIQEGAKIAIGGGRPEGVECGFFLNPTVFVDVDNSMAIAQKEFFGPVNVVIPFASDDDAVRIANDSDFGLWGAVRAKDPARALAIARRLRTGTVVINGGGGLFGHSLMPFGGYKNSGLGREYGAAGLDEYLETKAITWGVAEG